MHNEYVEMLFRLVAALAAGGIIGLERSYRGRAAGFRTHALVCVASSLLMLVTVYEHLWFNAQSGARVVVDPTRMAQGIMTGIGFLGAGVIVREGLTVRGLTTAASIWITAAIGILAGTGFYSAVLMGSVITIGILTVFRKVESRMPLQVYANNTIVFGRDNYLPETEVRELHEKNGFSVAKISYRLLEKGAQLEYRMTVRTMDSGNIEKLSKTLLGLTSVVEFNISMAGD